MHKENTTLITMDYILLALIVVVDVMCTLYKAQAAPGYSLWDMW